MARMNRQITQGGFPFVLNISAAPMQLSWKRGILKAPNLVDIFEYLDDFLYAISITNHFDRLICLGAGQ
jgi:hypothetical protein